VKFQVLKASEYEDSCLLFSVSWSLVEVQWCITGACYLHRHSDVVEKLWRYSECLIQKATNTLHKPSHIWKNELLYIQTLSYVTCGLWSIAWDCSQYNKRKMLKQVGNAQTTFYERLPTHGGYICYNHSIKCFQVIYQFSVENNESINYKDIYNLSRKHGAGKR
jgi:hypothetical protein